jgi:hypothetical protein
MAEITVKFDPTVDIEEIKMALITSTPEEEPDNFEGGEYQQTKVEGIAAPMVRLNNLAIMSDQVIRMTLTDSPIPRVDIDIDDTFGLSRVLDSPQSDNLMVIQVIPPFDNGYKKINLRFYITDYRIVGSTIRVHGEYNVPGQHDIVLESFGKKTTYEFVEEVAKRLQLGLASNIDGTDDSRYIYCPSKELFSVVSKEVPFGGNDTQLLDWWVDWWNYVNLVDIYDRYNSTDPIPKIWTMTTNGVELNESNSTEPVEVDAVITNHPSMNGTPLHIDRYEIESNTSSNLLNGTDKTIETYSMLDLNSETTDVMDGDIHNDIFKKYEYCGEVFGEHNYLVQDMLQKSFLQKMNSQKITVELNRPQFGLVRGARVSLNWYECSDFVGHTIEEENEDISTNSDEIDNTNSNSPDTNETGEATDNSWILNKTVSGQYYIVDSILKYDHSGGMMNWRHNLILSRPASGVETYMGGES